MYEKDYSHQLNKHARQTLVENRWNNSKKLPEAQDVAKLVQYLETNEKRCILKIKASEKTSFDIKSYKELSRLTLVHLIVFNRKRAGEVSKIILDFMEHRHESRMDTESNNHVLDKMEKKLSKLMKRIEIRGKKKRGVALLLTPHLSKCCDVLVKFRPAANIPHKNEYFFASGDGYIRGSDAIRKVCNILQIENITSTSLRKHLATMVHIMSLPNHQLERLAEFMGHNLDVHKNFYRLANDVQDRAKLTKLFMCLSKGTKYIDNMKNKTFDNIDITNDMLEDIMGDREGQKDEEEQESDNMEEECDQSDDEEEEKGNNVEKQSDD